MTSSSSQPDDGSMMQGAMVRCLPWILVCLWCASSSPAPRGTLDEVLLVVTVALAERLHLTRRYERHFGGVAYLVFHGGVPRTLTRAECERRRVGCLFADRGGRDARMAAYAQLAAALAKRQPGLADPAWLRLAWRRPVSPRGAAVAHMDFWLQPNFFAAALASGALDADAPCGAAKESEIPNFKGSDLGHSPLVSADFWTSDHLSERSRSVDAFSVTRARGTLTLKRR